MLITTTLFPLLLQAASLSSTSVPGSGRHEVILTLDSPGAVHLSARSGSGTSCEVIDRVRGPFARAGQSGRTNCELDLLLDAGQYKVRLESPLKGKGAVSVSATPFVEVITAPVKLVAGVAVEASLKLGQQASFWLPVPTRGVPFVRVAGRNAGDLRLWRNGEWLEPLTFRRATVTHTPGLPMTEWWIDQVLEPGDYRLVVYGRDPVTVTGASVDDSLTVEMGFRPGPKERSATFTLPVSGVLALEVPRTPLAAYVSLESPPASALTLQFAEFSDLTPLSLSSSCTVPKGALVPDCGVRTFGSAERRVVLVRGPQGARGTLEWATTVNSDLGWLSAWNGGYYGGPSTSFSFSTQLSGRVLVGTHDLPIDPDAAPLGCQLEQLSSDGSLQRIVGRSMTRLESGEALEKDFNYDEGGSVIWFEIASSNRYRLRTEGGRKNRCEVSALKPNGALERLTQTRSNDAVGCDEVLALGTGQYQLQLFGGVSGVEKLTLREEDGLLAKAKQTVLGSRTPKLAAVRSGCLLPPVDLTAGQYRLTLTRVGAITARGVSLTSLPLELSAPVHLTLDARQTVTLPLRSGPAFTVRSSGGARFGCQRDRAGVSTNSAECQVPTTTGDEALTVANPGDQPVQLTLFRPVAAPPVQPASPYAPTLTPLPRIAPEQPAWFDFARDQTNSVAFDVEAPGLYIVTTLGLLSTSCRLRTPVVDEVATNTSGGRGRNCLIQTYLQKGRYLFSATTRGDSRGRGALFLLRKPAREYAGVSGEGESFYRVEANELVQQKLVVTRAGDFQLGTTAPGGSLLCRLDDPQGWPIETVPSACVGARSLSAGTYLWTQLPLTVESMRRTSLQRVREPVVLKGNRPHAVSAFTWYDAELGSDGKDEFTFTLEGETTLDVVLTQGMQGRVFLLEKDKAPKAVEVIPPQVTGYEAVEPGEEPPAEEPEPTPEPEYSEESEGDGDTEFSGDSDASRTPTVAAGSAGLQARAAPLPPSGAKLTLPAGSYSLVTEHSKGDVAITYKLHFGSAVLLPGMSRTLPVPSTVPLTIPRDGTLRLRTEGEADVRCRLFDERKKLVLEGSDNGADWNCALAEPVSRGRYTLVLESETQLAGETKLSLSLPTVEDKGAFADAQKLTLGSSVVQWAIPAGDAVQELTVKATGKTPFSCAVLGPFGVASRRSRVSECAMLVLPKQEAWTLRVWTTDGSVPVTTAVRARTLASSGQVTATQALTATITQAGRFKTAPNALCLRGRETGVFEQCGPEVSLEAGAVTFAAFGTTPTPVSLDEVRYAAAPAPVSLELSRTAHLQVVTGSPGSLFLLSALTGWGEAAPPACGFDGPGTVKERRDTGCFAASKVGAEALARVWAATDAPVTASVVRRELVLPPKAAALTPGRKRVAFSSVGTFTLPGSSRARVDVTLPSGAWAVLLDGAGNSVDLCAPTGGLRRCVVSGQGGTLVLAGVDGQADVTTVLLETAPPVINFTGLYEDSPRAAGTVRLAVPAAEGDRVLLVEGALRCTVSLSTGERLADCRVRLPARTAAELVLEHDLTALRVLVHAPGREKFARLGIELPVMPGPLLSPAVAVPLQAGRVDRTMLVDASSVVRVAAEAGVCGLFKGNDLLAVDGSDTGCELVRVLTPGTYRLLVRPFAQRASPGSLRWLAEPVVSLTEGVGSESWLAPGEARLFTFDTRAKGRVGLGLQAASEGLECAVYNDGYQLLGEGCQQYLALEKGRFLLTVRNPNRPGAAPLAVKPVLLGLSGDSDAVPAEYLNDFFSRVGATP